MNFVRCSKGHFYDSDRHAFCPQCGKPEPVKAAGDEENRTVQLGGGNSGSGAAGNRAAADEEYKTVQLNLGGNSGNGASGNMTGADEEYKTVQLNLGGNGSGNGGNATGADEEYKTVQLNLGGNGSGNGGSGAAGNTTGADEEYKTVQLNLGGNGGNGTSGNATGADEEYKTVQLNLGGNGTAGNDSGNRTAGETTSASDGNKAFKINFGPDGHISFSKVEKQESEKQESEKQASSLDESIRNLQSEYDSYTLEKDAEILMAAGKKDAADQIAEKIKAAKESDQTLADDKCSDGQDGNQPDGQLGCEPNGNQSDDKNGSETIGTSPESQQTVSHLRGWIVQLENGRELSTTIYDGFCGKVALGVYIAVNCGKEKAADAICINYSPETGEYVIFTEGYLLKLNGRIIEGRYRLVSGDRIGVGENEFIFVAFSHKG